MGTEAQRQSGSMPAPLTQGEAVFEKYLSVHKLSWQKDQLCGIKRPDYLVVTPVSAVLCEVKDFEESDIDRAAIKASLQTMRPFLKEGDEYTRQVDEKLASLQNVHASSAGSWDPFPRLQELVAEAGKQLRPAKGKLPCAVIVYNEASIPNERDLLVRLGIGKNRMFGPNFNTTVSALIVLEEFFPMAKQLEAELVGNADYVRKQFAGEGLSPNKLMAEILCQGLKFEDKLKTERPDLYEHQPRLRIYYNRYAALELPRDAFSGPFDVAIEPDALWDQEVQ